MRDTIRKREIVISINDYCDIPFEQTDTFYWKVELDKVLADYDIEITKVEVRDVDELKEKTND